jgi:hypothetical protein
LRNIAIYIVFCPYKDFDYSKSEFILTLLGENREISSTTVKWAKPITLFRGPSPFYFLYIVCPQLEHFHNSNRSWPLEKGKSVPDSHWGHDGNIEVI